MSGHAHYFLCESSHTHKHTHTHAHTYIFVFTSLSWPSGRGVIQQAQNDLAQPPLYLPPSPPHPLVHIHFEWTKELTNLLFNIGSLIVGGTRYDAWIREGCAQQGAHREEIQHGSHNGNNWINARCQKWAAARDTERERETDI